MSFSEYLEWKEYYKKDPFMSDRLEFMLARFMMEMIAPKVKENLTIYDFLMTAKKPKISLAAQIKAMFGSK